MSHRRRVSSSYDADGGLAIIETRPALQEQVFTPTNGAVKSPQKYTRFVFEELSRTEIAPSSLSLSPKAAPTRKNVAKYRSAFAPRTPRGVDPDNETQKTARVKVLTDNGTITKFHRQGEDAQGGGSASDSDVTDSSDYSESSGSESESDYDPRKEREQIMASLAGSDAETDSDMEKPSQKVQDEITKATMKMQLDLVNRFARQEQLLQTLEQVSAQTIVALHRVQRAQRDPARVDPQLESVRQEMHLMKYSMEDRILRLERKNWMYFPEGSSIFHLVWRIPAYITRRVVTLPTDIISGIVRGIQNPANSIFDIDEDLEDEFYETPTKKPVSANMTLGAEGHGNAATPQHRRTSKHGYPSPQSHPQSHSPHFERQLVTPTPLYPPLKMPVLDNQSTTSGRDSPPTNMFL